MWKLSKNRGFYYGPESDSPWNWDLMWKSRVEKESNQLSWVMQQNTTNGMGNGRLPSQEGTPQDEYVQFRVGKKVHAVPVPKPLMLPGLEEATIREKYLATQLNKERKTNYEKELEFLRMLNSETQQRHSLETELVHLSKQVKKMQKPWRHCMTAISPKDQAVAQKKVQNARFSTTAKSFNEFLKNSKRLNPLGDTMMNSSSSHFPTA